MSEAFDPTVYTRAPVINVSSGITLAQALVQACPKNAEAGVKKAAKHLKATAEQALADMTERNKQLGTFTEDDSRVLDNEADRAWGALRMRLQARTMIGEHDAAGAKRAADLDFTLFQGSSGFLNAEYAVQSSKMSAILKHVDDEGLAVELDHLAGTGFLAAVREVQPRYEAMVKERLRRDKASGRNLGTTVRALQTAIVHYATKVCGTVDLDDEPSAEAVRLALLPILNHRQSAARPGPAPAAPPAPPEPPPASPGSDPASPTASAT
jgi:hypothetical protein